MHRIHRRSIALLAALVLGGLGGPRQGRAEILAIDFESGDLYAVSTSDASLSLIGSTGVAGIGSLDYRPSDGFLYGFTVGGSTGAPPATLYRIDPFTAAATPVGLLGIGFVFEGGLVLAPNGTAYGVNSGGAVNPFLFSINLETGAATTIGVISGGDHDINGLAWRSDGMLVGLDRVTNSLLAINPITAASSVIAAVSPTVGAIGGMTVAEGVGYFSTAGFDADPAGSNELYSFNLFTGAHSLVGGFDGVISVGDGISGLAFIPEPSSLALLLVGAIALAIARFGGTQRRD
jgi:hypothetical protein